MFLPHDDLQNPNRLQAEIAKKIRHSLLSQRTKRECSWGYILEQKSKQRIRELKEAGSDKIEDYIAAFDDEMKRKNEEIQQLESEINRLKYRTSRQESGRPFSSNGLSISSKETDLYQGERLALIMESLKKSQESSERYSRRHHIFSDFINLNIQPSEREHILDTLKELLTTYRDMDPTTRQGLERLGFEIHDDGKHYKLTFRGERRCSFTLSKTSSDYRSGYNAFSEIRRQLF